MNTPALTTADSPRCSYPCETQRRQGRPRPLERRRRRTDASDRPPWEQPWEQTSRAMRPSRPFAGTYLAQQFDTPVEGPMWTQLRALWAAWPVEVRVLFGAWKSPANRWAFFVLGPRRCAAPAAVGPAVGPPSGCSRRPMRPGRPDQPHHPVRGTPQERLLGVRIATASGSAREGADCARRSGEEQGGPGAGQAVWLSDDASTALSAVLGRGRRPNGALSPARRPCPS
jgi:hypothetical protein